MLKKKGDEKMEELKERSFIEEINRNMKETNEWIKDLQTMKLKLELYNKRFDQMEEYIENIDKGEKLHFEYIVNKLNKMEQKLTADINDLFRSFSIGTTKETEISEDKIKDKLPTRKIELSQINSFNDYDRIILKNLESRISILEEETQKYDIN